MALISLLFAKRRSECIVFFDESRNVEKKKRKPKTAKIEEEKTKTKKANSKEEQRYNQKKNIANKKTSPFYAFLIFRDVFLHRNKTTFDFPFSFTQ